MVLLPSSVRTYIISFGTPTAASIAFETRWTMGVNGKLALTTERTKSANYGAQLRGRSRCAYMHHLYHVAKFMT